MRIISPFHDYYDGLNDGSDREHLWVRKTTTFLDKEDPFFLDKNWTSGLFHQMDPVYVPNRNAVYTPNGRYWGLGHDSYRRSLLLFCGQFFPLVRVGDAVCWTFEEFEASADLPNRPYATTGFFRKRDEVYAKARKMFSLDDMPARYATLNLRYRCPVLLLDIPEQDLGPVREHEKERFRVRVTLNPRLYELGFQKVLPVFDAYQRIEMYLFNELAEQKDPPVAISDDIRLAAHGFDKYSFRKEKSPKGKKRGNK